MNSKRCLDCKRPLIGVPEDNTRFNELLTKIYGTRTTSVDIGNCIFYCEKCFKFFKETNSYATFGTISYAFATSIGHNIPYSSSGKNLVESEINKHPAKAKAILIMDTELREKDENSGN